MKTIKLFFAIMMLIAGYNLTAQVAITTDGSSADASSMFEVRSTTKGFLPPRMTEAERDVITPADGLIIYNTTTQMPNYYNGTLWMNFDGTSAELAIGDAYEGGKVAYIYQSGDPGYVEGETHGLIAAASDQSSGAQWGCQGTLISGADATALGAGAQNTIDILAGCLTSGIAAELCDDYSNGGFVDWCLPSKDELSKLYLSKDAVGGYGAVVYWSSTEYYQYNAYLYHFGTNTPNFGTRTGSYSIRAIRYF